MGNIIAIVIGVVVGLAAGFVFGVIYRKNVAEKEKLLIESGVIVVKSNYQSAKLASAMMNELDRR